MPGLVWTTFRTLVLSGLAFRRYLIAYIRGRVFLSLITVFLRSCFSLFKKYQDRRPASNVDPYLATAKIMDTVSENVDAPPALRKDKEAA